LYHRDPFERLLISQSNGTNDYDIDLTLMGKDLTLDNSVYLLMDIFDESSLPYSWMKNWR